MKDYKELISALREEAEAVKAVEWEIPICTSNHILAAADAIEQLVKERDAAVADINATVCHSCVNTGTENCRGADGCAICCNSFYWRGAREESDEKERNV